MMDIDISIDDEIGPADRTSELIGDGSQPYALPTLKIKHDRFKRIDASTLVKLIDGDFKDTIEAFTIIDCRYPYEYQGGHIVNSLNIHNTTELTKLFIDEHEQQQQQQQASNNNNISIFNNNNSVMSEKVVADKSSSSSTNRRILIFHCEFSSERGPKLMRFLREKDRQINKYPELLHPELYLLQGGYKEFYKKFKEYCVPQAYKPMNCRYHRDELRKFRKRKKVSNHSRRKENRVPDISFEG